MGKIFLDLEQARETFFRVARQRIKSLHPGLRHIEIDRWAHPTWVFQQSVAVQILPNKDSLDEAAKRVTGLLDWVAKLMSISGKPVLIGPMNTQIHNIGNGFFNFVVKVRFSEGHDDQASG